MKTLTTIEAATRLGVTPRRVRALISAGQLPADKKGRDYFIDPKDLALVRNRKPGRPAKKGKKQRQRVTSRYIKKRVCVPRNVP